MSVPFLLFDCMLFCLVLSFVMALMAPQVVGCVVRSCDTTAYPPKLSLALDVAGKTEQMGDATAQEVRADLHESLNIGGFFHNLLCFFFALGRSDNKETNVPRDRFV